MAKKRKYNQFEKTAFQKRKDAKDHVKKPQLTPMFFITIWPKNLELTYDEFPHTWIFYTKSGKIITESTHLINWIFNRII